MALFQNQIGEKIKFKNLTVCFGQWTFFLECITRSINVISIMKQSKGVHFYVTIDQAIVLQNRLWQMIAIVETKDTQILFKL